MITAVHTGVAIQAVPIERPVPQLLIHVVIRCSRGNRVERPRMAGVGMTLLAKERCLIDQKRVMSRTVRRVACRAVLGHRSMLKEERASLFSMALIAHIVD